MTEKHANTEKKDAFTLVELLIVITIIGLLAVALLPRLSAGRERARDASRLKDLTDLTVFMEQIIDDFSGGTSGTLGSGFCLQNVFVRARMLEYMSSTPIETVTDNKWVNSNCISNPPWQPNEGYDYIGTQNGYLLVAKLENEKALGENIYEESSLANEDNTTTLTDRTTQDIVSSLTACLNSGDCTSPIAVVAR